MICGGRIYKGQDNYIELYVPDASGITGIEIYTGGELKITPEEYEIVDENTIGINLTAEDLDPLEDGVIYYTVEYEDGGMGTNSNYYLKTPAGYTASTLDELIEEAYDEGYADGQEDCTGGTCEGVYESGYTDGYESGYTEGYESGSTSGYEEGYASGSTDGYNSGHTDGEAEQKAKLTSTSITENNIYTRDDGWNYVTVNVPQTGHTDEELHEAYDSGFTQGEAAQKAKLVSTAFTENRLYFREDGFSTVSVNVPQTGYTQQDLDNAYASGKTDGYDSGYTEGYNGGYTDGYNQGTADGYQTGYAEGEEAGYQTGYSAGEEAGYHSGYTDGYQSGYTRGTTDGYNSGYTDGLAACESGDTPSTGVAITYSIPENSYATNITAGKASSFSDATLDGTTPINIKSNTYNGRYMFADAGTHIIEFTPTGDTIDTRMFAYSCVKITDVVLPEGITTIGTECFSGCRMLTGVTLCNSLATIGAQAFMNCSAMTEFHITSGVTTINGEALRNCSALTGITIPSSVTYIGEEVFEGCSGLTEMVFEGTTPPTLGNATALGETSYNFPIWVPCDSYNAYVQAFGQNYAQRIMCAEG